MDIRVKEEVLYLLKTLPVCIPNSTKKQWTTRCRNPHCKESKNPKHGHLSIKIDLTDDSPMLYRCFKCEDRGIVDDAFLENLGFRVTGDMHDNLKTFNKHAMKTLRRYNIITEAPELGVPVYEPSARNTPKLLYLNERLGLDLTFEECQKRKIIFNLKDFIVLNNIEALPAKDSKLKLLNNNYIGFLSSNNNCITFRNIKKDDMPRYLKLIINPNLINPYSFYNPTFAFDPVSTEEFHIHIAEGTFDINSIMSNVSYDKNVNNVFFACCGFGYVHILKYILSIGINTNITLHIYCDNDKSDKDVLMQFKPIEDRILIWFDKIYLHRNAMPEQKDYGVPREYINDTRKKVWDTKNGMTNILQYA